MTKQITQDDIERASARLRELAPVLEKFTERLLALELQRRQVVDAIHGLKDEMGAIESVEGWRVRSLVTSRVHHRLAEMDAGREE